ncbi:phage protein D [Serratia sp. BIGb0234]|uniref:phage baseplate assembly protein V n=1 Tax=Serratia sp. BIGb0234 TaxID=2940614 RepID=UPI0021682A8D|nr:phage baseplate assembly protein V [Serratia sp. BIGb0234]MCS4320703.1 phage protein D [Serratia sp. BIGb0234]
MKHLTLDIAGQRIKLRIRHLRVQQLINEIPLAQLELRIPTDNHGVADNEVQREVSRFTLGARVVIARDEKTLFNGYLVQKKIQLKGKYWSVRLEARHALQKLTFLPRSRVFSQQDDHTLLKALLRPAGVSLTQKAYAQLSSKHDQLIQFRLSDWQFIRSRLLSTNCWLLPDATSDAVVISPLSDAAIAPRTLTRKSRDYTLYEVNLSFDNRFTLDSLSLQGWDIAAQRLTPAQKSPASAFRPWKPEGKAGQSPAMQQDYALAFSMLPEATLKTLSNSWLNHQQMTGVQGYIELAGTRNFAPGESITLSGFGAGLDGTVILSGVNQRFNIEDGWRSELVIGMPASMLEPAPPVRSLHIGKVADFTADPQHLDRIALHLPALNLPDSLIFARLSKPWASHASGFCFYPEPGDEVVVGFIDSDPRYPIILGAMHNPKNTAPFPPDEKNNRKGLIVNKADQTQALMIDTDEKTLRLMAGDNTLTLTGEGDIAVSTPNVLQLQADTLGLQADSNLSINGKQQVEITSAKINMKK